MTLVLGQKKNHLPKLLHPVGEWHLKCSSMCTYDDGWVCSITVHAFSIWEVLDPVCQGSFWVWSFEPATKDKSHYTMSYLLFLSIWNEKKRKEEEAGRQNQKYLKF